MFAVTGLAALLVSDMAWADTDLALHAGQAPATAAGFPVHRCDGATGGGPYSGQDVWSFVLPDRTHRFVAVTASFDTNGDSAADTMLSTSASGGIEDGGDTSKAWIVAPAGATLLTATAVATGTTPPSPDFFNIMRTCPAEAAPSPSPPALSSPSAAATPDAAAGAAAGTASNAGADSGREPRLPSAPSSQGAVVGSGSSGTAGAGISTGSLPGDAQNAGGSGGIGPGSLVLGVGALLGSVAGAGALMMFRQRRNLPRRPRRAGRHHRITDSAEGRAYPVP